MVTPETLRIVAPVSSVEGARKIIEAGADELYVGAMFDEWSRTFGEADLLSRRQGRRAHLRQPDQLEALARLGSETGHPVCLTLNARYSRWQEQAVLDLAERWADMGGQAVIVTDLGIVLALAKRQSGLKQHLSLLAGTFNSRSAAFFAELGVARVVLPRHLTLAEIHSIVEAGPSIEYEALVMYQKCQFIDGMCGFYHGLRLPEDVPAEFDYAFVPGHDTPVVYSHDPLYEGHGCQLRWQTGRGAVLPLRRDDESTPHCGACAMAGLADAGVGFLKIAGRGYPTDMIVGSVRFLREAIRIVCGSCGIEETTERIRMAYARTFQNPCDGSRCYYPLSEDFRA